MFLWIIQRFYLCTGEFHRFNRQLRYPTLAFKNTSCAEQHNIRFEYEVGNQCYSLMISKLTLKNRCGRFQKFLQYLILSTVFSTSRVWPSAAIINFHQYVNIGENSIQIACHHGNIIRLLKPIWEESVKIYINNRFRCKFAPEKHSKNIFSGSVSKKCQLFFFKKNTLEGHQ